MEKLENELGQSPSLYLQQHAQNPVHWKIWESPARQKAVEENKLLVISIGYSSCHWCHVMEEESFEDTEVAALMNDHFISIKVDREERPDIDAQYMNAVQLMTGQGGWPLNVIALPDGTPVYGGTYFSKADWIQALEQVQQLWESDPQRVKEYGEQMKAGLIDMISVSQTTKPSSYRREDFEDVVAFWMRTIDPVHGGPNGAPKFPLPNNYEFLLDYALTFGDQKVLDYTFLTLDKMALGGMYDQLHGGFTRYSTDRFWKVPHFEKMLYDNAQLVGLYSKAHRASGSAHYAHTVHSTVEFLVREMRLGNGLYASALDADSATPREEREEGGFYTWTAAELDALELEHKEAFYQYYDLVENHEWEGKFILHRNVMDQTFAQQQGWTIEKLETIKEGWQETLLQASKNRSSTHPKPTRDDKALVSWNALLCSGLSQAHWAFPNSGYDSLALELMDALLDKAWNEELRHSVHSDGPHGTAFLDDYATFGNALLAAYQLSGDNSYLYKAAELHQIVEAKFIRSGTFYPFDTKQQQGWQAVIEIEDNVIPSANSIYAHFLHDLGTLSGKMDLISAASELCEGVHGKVFKYGPNFSNWLQLALTIQQGSKEAVFLGPDAFEMRGNFTTSKYIPGTLFLAATSPSEDPLFKDRFPKDGTLIFICENQSCQLPTAKLETALTQWN